MPGLVSAASSCFATDSALDETAEDRNYWIVARLNASRRVGTSGSLQARYRPPLQALKPRRAGGLGIGFPVDYACGFVAKGPKKGEMLMHVRQAEAARVHRHMGGTELVPCEQFREPVLTTDLPQRQTRLEPETLRITPRCLDHRAHLTDKPLAPDIRTDHRHPTVSERDHALKYAMN